MVTYHLSAAIGDPLQRNTFAGYSRHYWTSEITKDPSNEIVWVNRWYNPEDDRNIAPVPRHKFLEQPLPTKVPLHWVSHPEVPLKTMSRSKEENKRISSAASLRSGDWSTLRQILPFIGYHTPLIPPRWGTNTACAPPRSERKPRRFGHHNSTMTNYVDEMHQTNKLFRLY